MNKPKHQKGATIMTFTHLSGALMVYGCVYWRDRIIPRAFVDHMQFGTILHALNTLIIKEAIPNE